VNRRRFRVTLVENYAAARDELFGADWPESVEKKLNSVPNLSQEQEGLPDVMQEAFVSQ